MGEKRFHIKGIMDDLTIRRKLVVLFVFCVLMPLIVTDTVIIWLINRDEETKKQFEMGNIATSVRNDVINTVEEAVNATKGVYINRKINEFLDKEYETPSDFYSARYEMLNQPFTSINIGSREQIIVMYTDNPTIVGGGTFGRLDSQQGEEWLKAIEAADRDLILIKYFIDDKHVSEKYRKRISVVRRLNYYKNLKYDKYIKIDLDYGAMARHLVGMKYSMPVYLCTGDDILYSNEGYSDVSVDFDRLTDDMKFAYESDFEIYGMNLRVLVKDVDGRVWRSVKNHAPVLLLLLIINVILPIALMIMINRSFVGRLTRLSQAFDSVNEGSDSLKVIDDINGTDEIGSLMRNYNRMTLRLKELIKTVYEDRLEKQEIDIARQQAELLALHSQINPHFLFNVLESIRMHSIIKREDETAGMIEKLALLQRQNVDWSDDHVKIKDELKFIEAYLDLQKYRFGDKLSYQISIKNGCENYYLPRLTLETFVENACVHGAEGKAGATHIYVRVYEQDDSLYMEVEDTGEGMSEAETKLLNEKLKDVTIEDLKTDKHVGMINACLRLKMLTNNRAFVNVESEKGVGTTIFIDIPLDTLKVSV